MRVLLDSSALVAAMVASHASHTGALNWLAGTHAGRHQAVVAAHSLAEVFAVLSTLPLRSRLSPLEAERLIGENILAKCSVQELKKKDYARVLSRLAEVGISGGAVYDALIAEAAILARVERLVTLNVADFIRFPWLKEAGIDVGP